MAVNTKTNVFLAMPRWSLV